MLKLLLAATVVAAPIVAPAADPDTLVFLNYPGVFRIDCSEGHGTGFRVAPGHFFSAAHVTSMHGCTIGGATIHVTEQDGDKDFAQFDAEAPTRAKLKISCEGFHAGEWYWAAGFARGLPFQTAIAVYATFAKAPDGKRVLIGPYDFIPGMSGGPVMNARGEVVGTVNAFLPGTPISLSRDLRDTSVCHA